MSDRCEQALRTLGLEAGATEHAIRDAYRDLVKVWHPDRFGSDARLREKAQDKLKEVNAAFAQLRGYRASDFTRPRQSAGAGDGGSDFSGSRVAETVIAHAKHKPTRNVLILVLSAVLTGFVGTGLFISRSRTPRQLAPASGSAGSPRVPAIPQPARRELSSGADAAREIPVLPKGSLMVASRPMGARVSFDGRAVGETPIVVTDVTPGEHHIDMTLEGAAYQPWSSSVNVAAGQEEKVLAVMSPMERGR